MLSGVCAYAQTRQSLRCSHTQSIHIGEGSDQTLELYLFLKRQYGP